MPTYDYKCHACDHEFEMFQSITAPSVRKCPKCGKIKVKRLIGTGAGIIFKGSGFYQTDYRTDSYKQGAQKDKPATAASDKGSTSGSASASTGSSTNSTGGSSSSAGSDKSSAKSGGAAKSDSSGKSDRSAKTAG